MTRIDIINSEILKYGYKTYLEIGVRNKDHCFNKIKVIHKIGVDPDPEARATHVMTSDDYFERYNDKFDLIFVDGLHHAEQTYKDILNSLDVLNKGGTVIIHDCLPHKEKFQKVPQDREEWTGDVWKAFLRLRYERDDLFMMVVDTDYGVGIVREGEQVTIDNWQMDYKTFYENRKELLNIRDYE